VFLYQKDIEIQADQKKKKENKTRQFCKIGRKDGPVLAHLTSILPQPHLFSLALLSTEMASVLSHMK